MRANYYLEKMYSFYISIHFTTIPLLLSTTTCST